MSIPEYATLPSESHTVPSRSRLGRLVLGLVWWSLLLALSIGAVLGVGALVVAILLLWHGEWLLGSGFFVGVVLLAFSIRFVGQQVEAVGRSRRKDIDWGEHF